MSIWTMKQYGNINSCLILLSIIFIYFLTELPKSSRELLNKYHDNDYLCLFLNSTGNYS